MEAEAKRTVKWNWTCIARNKIQFSADFQYKTTVIDGYRWVVPETYNNRHCIPGIYGWGHQVACDYIAMVAPFGGIRFLGRKYTFGAKI